jgi:hypothetical protein
MAAMLCCAASALLVPSPLSALSRRAALQQAVGASAAVVAGAAVQPAFAAEESFSKMGGLLEPYIDTQRGYKLYKPAGWNQFNADPGVYDIKFQDIMCAAALSPCAH